jgi:hypothetical protein
MRELKNRIHEPENLIHRPENLVHESGNIVHEPWSILHEPKNIMNGSVSKEYEPASKTLKSGIIMHCIVGKESESARITH